MRKYRTESKLEVVQTFLAGEGGAKLLARRWSDPYLGEPLPPAWRRQVRRQCHKRLTQSYRLPGESEIRSTVLRSSDA